jgi:hypothetical protein
MNELPQQPPFFPLAERPGRILLDDRVCQPWHSWYVPDPEHNVGAFSSSCYATTGEREKFKKVFEEPIMAGRQPGATEKEKSIGDARSKMVPRRAFKPRRAHGMAR